jgi:hypothetical protein
MTYTIAAALFNDERDAQQAVDWLRDKDVPDTALTVVTREGEYPAQEGVAEDRDAGEGAGEAGSAALTGAGIGAGVGALFGLAAAAIPGIGPFITAGALAQLLGATGGAAAAGAVVGGTSGALAGALSHWGLNEADARYYAGEVERGNTFVGVDLAQTSVSRDEVLDALRRFNGRFAS